MKPSDTESNASAPPFGGPDDPCVGLDRFGRVIDQRWLDNATADIERIQYGYDAGSRRTWRREAAAPGLGQDEAYRYDGLSQVVERRRGDLNLAATAIGTEVAGEAFDYDPAGNWDTYRAWSGGGELVQPRTHNQANELVVFDGSGAVVAYDAAGRMTVVPAGETPEDGTWQLVWDAWSRLVVVDRVVDGGVVSAIRHQYDGLFRRTRTLKTTSPTETRDFYYNSAWKVIEERVQSPLADRTELFVYGLRGRNDLVFRDRIEGGTTTRHYALSDAMGSITAITNDDGEVVERYAYSAFGMSRVMDADFAPRTTSAHDWQVRFHGESRDPATGWYNYGYRLYLPELGRWPSRDTIEEAGGVNLYGFVGNNGGNDRDFLGLAKIIPPEDYESVAKELNRQSEEFAKSVPPPVFPDCEYPCVITKILTHSGSHDTEFHVETRYFRTGLLAGLILPDIITFWKNIKNNIKVYDVVEVVTVHFRFTKSCCICKTKHRRYNLRGIFEPYKIFDHYRWCRPNPPTFRFTSKFADRNWRDASLKPTA